MKNGHWTGISESLSFISSQVEFEHLTKGTAERLAKLLCADCCWLTLLESPLTCDSHSLLWVNQGDSESLPINSDAFDSTITDELLRSDESFLCTDQVSEKNIYKKLLSYRLQTVDKTIGAMEFGFKSVEDISIPLAESAFLLVTSLAGAIDRMQNSEQVHKHISKNQDKIDNHNHDEQLLKSIVEGTGAEIGENFFRSVVQHLAAALQARYTIIGKFSDDGFTIQTIAVWDKNQLVDNFSYTVAGSTGDACADKLCYCTESGKKLLPDANTQKTMNISSCWGIPLNNSSGITIGVLGVMHDGPMQREENIIPIMKIFAARTASELERAHTEELLSLEREALREHRDHLEDQVKSRIEDLEIARDAALTADKVKSQFLANMSHELRTPLTAIIGFCDLLNDEAVESGLNEFIPYLDGIKKAGNNLTRLISDILDMSNIEAGNINLNLDFINLEDLVHDSARAVDSLATQNSNKLKVICQPNLGIMYSDAKKVRQTIYNLLNNAFKFTTNGHIELTVHCEIINRDEWVVVQIKDTGIGLEHGQLENLFKLFTQVDTSSVRKYGGSGLGLAICNHNCQLLGGDISASSQPGQGSVFTVRFKKVIEQNVS